MIQRHHTSTTTITMFPLELSMNDEDGFSPFVRFTRCAYRAVRARCWMNAVYSIADILLYYTFLCLFPPSPRVFLKLETLPGFPVSSLVTKLNDSMQSVTLTELRALQAVFAGTSSVCFSSHS